MATVGAIVFVWLGMVLAISFLEAPLKFRAPDVTLRIGLGIGRLVFRALNAAEALLAVCLVMALLASEVTRSVVIGSVVVIAILMLQLIGVRPALTRRSDLVLAGEDGPRSSAHLVYVALEIIKVIALVATGVFALQPF